MIAMVLMLLPRVAYAANPTITNAVMDANNVRIQLSFSEEIYTNSDGTGGVTPADFTLSFVSNGGAVSNATTSGPRTLQNGDPIGGETGLFFYFSLTGAPASGVETIAITPKDGASIYNGAGEAMAAGQTTGAITLNDKKAPAFAATYPKAGNPQAAGSKQVSLVVKPLDETVDVYYVVLANNAPAPSADEVIAGTGVGGTAAIKNGSNAAVTTGGIDIGIILTDHATDYDAYVVITDAANNKTGPAKVDLRTPAAVASPGHINNFTCTTIDNTSATFAWSQATGASAIKIQYSLDNNGTWADANHVLIDPAATTATVTGLTQSTAYLFKLVVTAGSNAGDSNHAQASTSPYGTISGTVTDGEGNPLAEAGLNGFAATGPSNPIGFAMSGADGSYSISNVPVGTGRYVFSSKQHYIVKDAYDITVTQGNTTTVNFEIIKILATGYPVVGPAQAAGSKMIQIQIKANGDATTAYYVVVPDGSTAPSASQIQAGKDSANAAALYAGGGALAANIEQGFATTALPADATAYDVYVVLARGAYESEVVKLDVTTPDAINIPVSAITVTGAGAVSSVKKNNTLQMAVSVLPVDATDNTVTWTVVNGTGSATIDASGLLTAVSTGTVTVKATANDGSGKVGEKIITITSSTSSSGGGGGGGSTTTFSGTSVDEDGGTVRGEGVTVVIPPNAVGATIKVAIFRVSSSGVSVPSNLELLSDIFDISKDRSGDFDREVTLTLPFDKNAAEQDKDKLAIYWWDGSKWNILDNIKVDWSAGTISGTVKHFTKFAVLASSKTETAEVKPEVKPETVKPTVSLNDISGHWAQEAISSLVASGAISGYADGSFKPNQTISRAEFATVLVKALKLPNSGNKVFADTAGHWAQDAIAATYTAGIISGYNDKSFGPDDPITREQMAVMIVKAARLTNTNAELNFADSKKISDWAKKAVSSAAASSLISGYPDNTFRPADIATRAEAVSVINRAIK